MFFLQIASVAIAVLYGNPIPVDEPRVFESYEACMDTMLETAEMLAGYLHSGTDQDAAVEFILRESNCWEITLKNST